MADAYRRISFWAHSSAVAAAISREAINRLFGPGLFCAGVSYRVHPHGTHVRVLIVRRESWDIRAVTPEGTVFAVRAHDYLPQGAMPAKFYRRLHKPWRTFTPTREPSQNGT